MRYIIWPIVLVAIAASGFAGWYLAQQDAQSADVARDEAERYAQWARNLKSVPVTFVINPPKDTPPDQTLYLSGSAPSLKAWAADGVPLTRLPDGKYIAKLDGENGLMTGLQHAFKVTRGNWATVETDDKGQERPNHTFTVDPQKDEDVVEVAIASWRDSGKTVPGRVTRTGNIILHRKFHSDELKNDRDVIVYLPPGYNDEGSTEARYPVLYMHDGQNLMDEDTSFKGVEWKVDETAEQLIKSGKIKPVIIVGVYNTEQRTPEFTPGWMATADAPGRGEAYGKLLVEQIKPMIDSTYRTKTDPSDTYLAGSSFGGLITLAILKQYPDKFAGAAVLTPYLQLNGKPLVAGLGENLSFLKGKKIWIDMGDQPADHYPGKDPVSDAKAFAGKLTAGGLAADKDFVFKEFPGTGHDEPSWQERVDQVLLYLFGS